jgi:adenylosuccinate synthase
LSGSHREKDEDMAGCSCVVGLQWGDEAKGKIVDLLAAEHDIVVRYNGGANAGHTVVVEGKSFKLSLLPSGIIRPDKMAVIGNGVVVYPPSFLDEVQRLRQANIKVDGNLLLSDRAHVIFPYHLEEEAALEESASPTIGTTRRGNGPCYQDKAGRHFAIRVGELRNAATLTERLKQIVPFKNRWLQTLSSGAKIFEPHALADQYASYGQQLAPHITDTTHYLHQAMRDGKRILFEAAQGSLLDVDHGTFPYVTSSNSSTAGIWCGSGVPARRLDKVIGVIKAYTTRVGGGPFPTELTDEVGEKIRRTGKEYGTVTGRPRRCGWFDAVAVRYSAALGGVDALAVMLLDVLSDFAEIKICTAYRHGGNTITTFPSDVTCLADCEPVYETLPGWQTDICGARSPQDLPPQARRYLDRLSAIIGLPVAIVSVGPDRAQTLFLP